MKHGHTANGVPTKEYRAWLNMRARCRTKPSYVKRKIKVCRQWRRSFKKFLEHIGLCPNALLTVDRIKNDVGYEPGNVRWATKEIQCRNRSNIVFVTVEGQRMMRLEACEKYSISVEVVRKRIDAGWSVDNAFTIPARTYKPRKKDHD